MREDICWCPVKCDTDYANSCGNLIQRGGSLTTTRQLLSNILTYGVSHSKCAKPRPIRYSLVMVCSFCRASRWAEPVWTSGHPNKTRHRSETFHNNHRFHSLTEGEGRDKRWHRAFLGYCENICSPEP